VGHRDIIREISSTNGSAEGDEQPLGLTVEPSWPKTLHAGLSLFLAVLCGACLWFYVDRVLVGYQMAGAAAHGTPRGNLSDLYPRWLGTRELLLRGRNPYSHEITLEIQRGYYGRVLDASRPDDPTDQQGFAYPIYVVFLLAPLIKLSFHAVQIFFFWFLIGLTAVSVPLWLRVLNWRLSLFAVSLTIVLFLGSAPAVQGIKLQQLTMLVAAMLAASVACIASGWLLSGGVILALATIKPQLVLPLALWLMVWSLSDWRSRWKVAFGFATTMFALLVGAEIVLPGWWRMFLVAIHQYQEYTQSESVLDQLVNWGAGRFGGTVLAALAVLLSAIVLWPARNEPVTSPEFGRTVALALALTVLIIPMYSPYNQVLLLPAILLLWRNRAWLFSASRMLRVSSLLAVFALIWPWMVSITLAIIWPFSRDLAFREWDVPFYTTFALPVMFFALMLFSTKRALRGREVAE
jgi:hypothetical protein